MIKPPGLNENRYNTNTNNTNNTNNTTNTNTINNNNNNNNNVNTTKEKMMKKYLILLIGCAPKQHPINNSVGGASSTKDRQKQPAHHLESAGHQVYLNRGSVWGR